MAYVINLEEATLQNTHFRQVLYTSRYCQLVVMALQPGEDIGQEVHELDQFFRVESGSGEAVVDGVSHSLVDGSAVVVPAGTQHNIRNVSADTVLKLYTIYAPPEHKDGTVHATKADAQSAHEHFDGVVSK